MALLSAKNIIGNNKQVNIIKKREIPSTPNVKWQKLSSLNSNTNWDSLIFLSKFAQSNNEKKKFKIEKPNAISLVFLSDFKSTDFS